MSPRLTFACSLVLAGMVFGCSSSSDGDAGPSGAAGSGGATPDASSDASEAGPEAGADAPQDVKSETTKCALPSPLPVPTGSLVMPGACSPTEVAGIAAAYATGGNPPTVSSGCATCTAVGSTSDPTWGALITNGSILNSNIGVCVAIASGDTACAAAWTDYNTCLFLECPCLSKVLSSCLPQADNGLCKPYKDAALACVAPLGADAVACTADDATVAFAAAIDRMCGTGAPADAGSGDAASEAADDANLDAGDPDAAD